MSLSNSRRNFLRTMAATGIATAGVSLTGCTTPQPRSIVVPSRGPGQKLRVAFIGTGGIGGMVIDEFAGLEMDCPCYCDVDTRHHGEAAKHWPGAKIFQDYRLMFDQMHREFDAVVICTPDHTHFPVTVLAMQHNKSVFTQKPLTHTVWEARQMTKMAKTYSYATQMGIQGHATEGWRVLYEWLHEGVIGDVTEVHTWTDRPIWPQGIDRPAGSDPVPRELDWNLWLGDAPERPYKNGVYHAFKWRAWDDFGCGALGDMACHFLDGMFWSLEPGYPTSVEPVEMVDLRSETFPKASIIKWTYPKTHKRPGFVSYWYDGHKKPPRPPELEAGRELAEAGSIYVGTKGTILVSKEYSPRLIPEARQKQTSKPKRILERSPGHYKEFVMAASGEKPIDFCKANFNYAAPMTETILLGNIAMRVGRKIDWDGKHMRITNVPEANRLLTKQYRKGFQFL